MNPDVEAKYQEASTKAQNENQYNAHDMAGHAYPQALAPPNLREAVNSSIRRAQVESSKLNQLLELQYLMDRYPEIARMVELINSMSSTL